MLVIGEAVVEQDVLRESFACDLDICKGACCTLKGGRGAPLETDEVLEIEKAFPHVRTFLSGRSLSTISNVGLWEGTPGDYATPCVESEECVFVYFDGDIARCSFERAYLEGLIDWRKPLSCHLYPIRIRNHGREVVEYDRIPECEAGRQRGRKDGIPLKGFLKDPLERKFGSSWYEQFVTASSQERTTGKSE